jgi:hypothetical protein
VDPVPDRVHVGSRNLLEDLAGEAGAGCLEEERSDHHAILRYPPETADQST